jgi:hypothetical protein
VTWKWPRARAETCSQFQITPNKLSYVLTNLKPSPYRITKHNKQDASKGIGRTEMCSQTRLLMIVYVVMFWRNKSFYFIFSSKWIYFSKGGYLVVLIRIYLIYCKFTINKVNLFMFIFLWTACNNGSERACR